ncbi:MAG TPA: T9SS type A sorting domain-containing protein [Saprospiraceae bacterium]|nr:T9SS type A sorting domain-containing protein [Saprospiraceae bacterium]
MKFLLTLLAVIFTLSSACLQQSPYQFDESLNLSHVIDHPLSRQVQQQFPSHFFSGISGKWSPDYSVPGITGYIYCAVADGGNLYLGGNFTLAGSTVANSIVKWDGQKWTSVGEGLQNGVSGSVPAVYSIAFADGKLFAGGLFSRAGTVDVNGIAWWDGSNWHALGSDSTNGVRQILFNGTDSTIQKGPVWSLHAHQDKIYVGGWFQFVGDQRTNGIAAWDPKTESWETLQGGFKSDLPGDLVTAYSYTSKGNELYVGGKFDRAGDVPAKNIARWDGSNWSAIGIAESIVTDLEWDSSGDLYALGYFSANGPAAASGIGKWDGSKWSSIPSPDGFLSNIHTIQEYHGELYAGGNFEINSFGLDYSIAKWDGANWSRVDKLEVATNEAIEGSVRALVVVNDRLFVAGGFTKAGDRYPINIAEWDDRNQNWKILDDGGANQGIHDGSIQVLERSGKVLYAGGDFAVAGGVSAKRIAKWNGSNWESLGTGENNGLNGSVYCILVDNDDVYVGGYFSRAGTEASFHVAKWNGSKWSPIGIGVGGVAGAHVRALAKVGNYLYVGGYFSIVGDEENFSLPANSIARFNLSTKRWETLGRGIEYIFDIPGRVYDMEVNGNRIFVGGEFFNADGQFYENVAVLTNNKWSGIDGFDDIGVEGFVRTIKVIRDEIYIGGVLRLEHQGDSYGLLQWDEKKWITVGDRFYAENNRDVYVNDIAEYDKGIIVGGFFKSAGITELNNLACFDGNTWQSVGGGVLPGVSKMAVSDNKLFVTGPRVIFTEGGPSMGIAEFEFDTLSTQSDGFADEGPEWNAYPNPATDHFRISFQWPAGIHSAELCLFDSNGKLVISHSFEKNGNVYMLDASSLKAGNYFLRIQSGTNLLQKQKIIIIKQ